MVAASPGAKLLGNSAISLSARRHGCTLAAPSGKPGVNFNRRPDNENQSLDSFRHILGGRNGPIEMDSAAASIRLGSVAVIVAEIQPGAAFRQ